MKIKKNWTMRAAMLLLALVLITACFVSGTFAKYVTAGKGSDSARVAKFGVEVTANGTMFAKEYATDDTDPDTVAAIAKSVISSDDRKVVAPGTKGNMISMALSGSPEVAVRVTYNATGKVQLTNWTQEDGTFYCPLNAFAGWYYSPGCYDGSEYTLGDKMSAQDVGLYAKWEPVSHNVRMFKTYDDMLRYEATGDTSGLISSHSVSHGSTLGSVDNPTDESEYHYSFGGWFFMSKGIKTAYTPLDMPVTRDLNVFADWGSLQAQPYIIHYALHNPETNQEWLELLDNAADGYPENNKVYTVSNGNDERKYVYLQSDNKYHQQIAGDSNGFAYQGNTRTFLPKAGEPYNQLSEGYNNGYFPTLGSHSITIEYEENKESPSKNVFTFTYVYATDIRYRVEYRYLDTDELIPSAPGGGIEEKTTSMAVMTERFAVIKDYIPDAFYKRLILAVEKDENGDYVGSSDNVITFYYTKNTQHAFYAVHNMLQNIDAESDSFDKDGDGNYINFTESNAITEGIGEIDSVHNIEPQKFSGFTVMSDGYLTDTGRISMNTDDPDRPHFQITVKAEGTELYIFYKRNIQNYKVYYLKYGTDISDLSSLTYDESDKEHTNGVVLPIDEGKASFGSTLTASAKPVSGMSCASNISQSIIIRANDDQNYIIFYYSSLKFTVEYKVWSYGGGSVDNTTEAVHGTTQFKGANATACCANLGKPDSAADLLYSADGV